MALFVKNAGMTTLRPSGAGHLTLSANEFEVGYIAEDGTRHRVPLAAEAAVRFEAMAPARQFDDSSKAAVACHDKRPLSWAFVAGQAQR